MFKIVDTRDGEEQGTKFESEVAAFQFAVLLAAASGGRFKIVDEKGNYCGEVG